jgi:predicted RNA-binding protein with PUA-like domain
MKKGDLAFFYHSNVGLNIVGVAEVTKEYYQDSTTDDIAWVTVDFKPFGHLKTPVNLDFIKKDSFLKDMQLVKISRLSVSVVTKKQYDYIVKTGKLISV